MKKGLSDSYSLKAHIERIFGHDEYLKIKEYPGIKQWNSVLKLLIKSYKKAISQSLTITTDIFNQEIEDLFSEADKKLNIMPENEEELFSKIISIQSELIYILLGGIQDYYPERKKTLSSNWNLSKYRQTQIVQSNKQKYEYLKYLIKKKFNMKQMGEMAEEKRTLNIKKDFYIWIFYEKMNGKFK